MPCTAPPRSRRPRTILGYARFWGRPGTQLAGTDALVERTGAAELIVAGTVYDPATRQDTLTRLLKAWSA